MFNWLLVKLEPTPKRLRIDDAGMEMDGGSLELTGTDERGKRRTVRLPVHDMRDPEADSKPRPLLLGIRTLRLGSPEEFALLLVLEQAVAEIRSRPVDAADGLPIDDGEGVNIYGDALLAECDSAHERLALCVEEVTSGVRLGARAARAVRGGSDQLPPLARIGACVAEWRPGFVGRVERGTQSAVRRVGERRPVNRRDDPPALRPAGLHEPLARGRGS